MIRQLRPFEEFALLLRELRADRSPHLTPLLVAAVELGWTKAALGRALGITIEAVRSRVNSRAARNPLDPDLLARIPLPPTPPATRVPPPPPLRPGVPPAVAARLRQQWLVARTVNGKTPLDHPHRRISLELTAAVQRLFTRGVSGPTIAAAVGCTNAAIHHRLGRHGYQPPSPSQAHAAYRGDRSG